MFARRGEQGSSVCPCARPGAWNAGVVGRGKRKPAVRLGLGRQGGAGAKAAPAGLPSALAAPITTADPRMQEVGTEDKPKQKPFPKLPPDPPCAGQAVPRSWLARGPHTVRTSGSPAEDWPRPPPRMCRATPSPPSRWHFRASSVPTPGAWLEGRLQLVVGGSAACAGEPLVGLVALAAPAAPRADHRRAGGCSEGQEGPRRGVGCASARVCQVRGRGLGLRLVGLSGGAGGRVLPTWQTS